MGEAVVSGSGEATDWAVRPLTSSCQSNFAQRDHACIGISPFNSYFSSARIAAIARWALSEFGVVHFFVPDVPAAHTLEALGYPPERARHKARRQGRYVYNKICRALADVGVVDPERLILNWSVLRGNGRYLQLLGQAHALFDEDPEFRETCITASTWVLDGRLPHGTEPTDQQLRVAVRYLLAELPLFIDTAGIVGHESSVFCYHQGPAFLERLYRQQLPWKAADNQGFLVVQPLHDDDTALHLRALAVSSPSADT
ncbi:tRNA-dependent cyclodipeptide synthase [Allosaccharopolyspora coralli]|uniref:tRNA-dependent cyclodipeptide synthase n=1 Tax=Allosaccharopolyspora coralli TaxID=2665642 RepID=UPI001E60A1C1|nr:tRNA-dependent cyclodipeptide synthase [Allosaccharopolyspora coralli]